MIVIGKCALVLWQTRHRAVHESWNLPLGHEGITHTLRSIMLQRTGEVTSVMASVPAISARGCLTIISTYPSGASAVVALQMRTSTSRKSANGVKAAAQMGPAPTFSLAGRRTRQLEVVALRKSVTSVLESSVWNRVCFSGKISLSANG